MPCSPIFVGLEVPFFLGRAAISQTSHARVGAPLHPPHSHQGAELGIVSDGQCEFYFEGQRYRLKTGDAIFVDGMLPHAIGRSQRAGFVYDYANVTFEALLNVPPAQAGLALVERCRRQRGRGLQVLQASEQTRSLLEGAVSLFERGGSAQLAAAWGTLVQVIATLIPNETERNPQSETQRADALLAAVSLIHHAYKEPLTLEEIARHCSLSVSHLVHIFSSSLNHSPIEYRNLIRIEKAKDMLLGTNDKIEAISSEIGFEHVGHFYRLFRRVAGMTPSAFRKAGALAARAPNQT